MAKRRLHARQVQITGNILRSFFIWAGIGVALLAAILLMSDYISDRVAIYMMTAVFVLFGFALVDFDVDNDD